MVSRPLKPRHGIANHVVSCGNDQFLSFLNSENAGRLTVLSTLWQLSRHWRGHHAIPERLRKQLDATGSRIPAIKAGATKDYCVGILGCSTLSWQLGGGGNCVFRTSVHEYRPLKHRREAASDPRSIYQD